MRCQFIVNNFNRDDRLLEKFTLTYQGPIPSGARNAYGEIKHRMRRAFSDQLYKFWNQKRLLKDYLNAGLPEASHSAGHFCEPLVADNPFFEIRKFGLHIHPLVTVHNRLSCDLEISLMVDQPKIFGPYGDLDNRIKIVFDALRMPQQEQEVPEFTRNVGSDQMFCLFEDDSLIQKFSVQAEHALSSPLVELLTVVVRVSSTSESHFKLHGF